MILHEDDLIFFRYTYDYHETLRQNEVAWAGWSLRREASLGGLGEIVNPKPIGEATAQFGIRLHRDAELTDIIRALPYTFSTHLTTMTDPNDSVAEDGTYDGDEQWERVEVPFTFLGFERDV